MNSSTINMTSPDQYPPGLAPDFVYTTSETHVGIIRGLNRGRLNRWVYDTVNVRLTLYFDTPVEYYGNEALAVLEYLQEDSVGL